MAYTHKINGIDVVPSGKLSIEGTFEEEYYQFSKRIKKVTIWRRSDYDFLMGIENSSNRCQQNSYELSENGNVIYNGRFTMDDCKFYPNQCKIEIDLSEDNSERCIRERWNNEYNLIDVTPETIYANTDTFSIFVYTGYDALNRRLVADGAPTPADYVASGVPAAEENLIQIDKINSSPLNEGGDDYNYYIAYGYRRARLQPTTGCELTLDGYDQIGVQAIGSDIYCIYQKLPPADEIVSNGSAVVTFLGISPGPEFTKIVQSPGNYYGSFYRDIISEYENNRARDFIDFLEHMLVYLCANIDTVESSFFQDSVNPISGETNYFTNMKMVQMSDFLDPTSSEPATRGMISFASLMKDLNTMFDVFWFTEGNKLRIEHRSYFMNLGTGINVIENSEKNMSYGYESNLPSVEKFKFPYGQSNDFVEHNITYDNSCLNGEATDITVSRLNTDVESLVQVPDIDKSMFVLLAVDSNGYVIKGLSETTGLNYMNYYLSWRYLISRFHKENRSALEGVVNGINTNFSSIKLTKNLAEQKLQMCMSDFASFNPILKAETVHGNAVIKGYKYDLSTGYIKLDLWQ